jgi:hypothetical protein
LVHFLFLSKVSFRRFSNVEDDIRKTLGGVCFFRSREAFDPSLVGENRETATEVGFKDATAHAGILVFCVVNELSGEPVQ